jgi:hypothetical protein
MFNSFAALPFSLKEVLFFSKNCAIFPLWQSLMHWAILPAR